MAVHFQYNFERDPAKAIGERRKHGVGFELAVTVFKDPLAVSCFDEGYSEAEELWVTLGQAENGRFLVVVHTSKDLNDHNALVWVISAGAANQA